MGIGSHFANLVEIPPPPEALAAKSWPAHGAVVGLISEDDRLIQLFSTQNLRKAIQKRLSDSSQPEGRSRRANLRAVTRWIGWTPSYSTFENAWRYLELSRTLLPDSYRKTLPFKPAWFAGINLTDEFPRWTMDTLISQKPIEVGPFRGKKSCAAFISQLEDCFELCRKHEVLVRAPHGEACSYYDMGRCPAPCNGTVSMTSYRSQLEKSVLFAQSRAADRLHMLRDEMNFASRSLRFEQAAYLKTAIREAEKAAVDLDDYRGFPSTVDNFRYFVLQRGSSRSRFKPFFADRHKIAEAEEMHPDNLDKLLPAWWERLSCTSCPSVDNTNYGAELISLVAYFARKRGPGHGLFVHRLEVASVGALEARIRRYGSPTSPAARLSDNG